jgi:hypothetical protein
MSFAGASHFAMPPPPPGGGFAAQPITPANTSSGANPATITQAAHTRMTMGEPQDPTPAPQFGYSTGQKTTLGQ